MFSKKSAKVLIVEDNYQISNIVKEKKTLLSHKPISVSRCKKALQVASRHPSSFDLLLTDIMTQKVNGEDFAQEFAKLSPRTQVVYIIL
jgi:DNA-binding NtrC family response regulator